MCHTRTAARLFSHYYFLHAAWYAFGTRGHILKVRIAWTFVQDLLIIVHVFRSVGQDSWEPEVTCGGHFGPVLDIGWNNVGEYFVSVSSDQTSRLHGYWVAEDEAEASCFMVWRFNHKDHLVAVTHSLL